jgi:hypothetical protein
LPMIENRCSRRGQPWIRQNPRLFLGNSTEFNVSL